MARVLFRLAGCGCPCRNVLIGRLLYEALGGGDDYR